MDSEAAARLRAQAQKCRELAETAYVPSSRLLLLKIAQEFDQKAESMEQDGNPGPKSAGQAAQKKSASCRY